MPNRMKKLNAFHLKVIAIIAMTICHIPYGIPSLQKNHTLFLLMSFIGGITLPIMAYLLVEGFRYTRSHTKYALRVAAFWLLSIIPYWKLFVGGPFHAIYLANNIMFTLLMGLLLLIAYENTRNVLLHVLLVLLFTALTRYSDWYLIGVLLIFAMYRFRTAPKRIILPILLVTILPSALSILYIVDEHITDIHTLAGTATTMGTMLAIPILLSYNGERGKNTPVIKWGFYAYYPLHILVLWGIRLLLTGR